MERSPWMLHALGKIKIEEALAECQQRRDAADCRRQARRTRIEPSIAATAIATMVLIGQAARTLLSARSRPTGI